MYNAIVTGHEDGSTAKAEEIIETMNQRKEHINE
jgi:hypothetical protein